MKLKILLVLVLGWAVSQPTLAQSSQSSGDKLSQAYDDTVALSLGKRTLIYTPEEIVNVSPDPNIPPLIRQIPTGNQGSFFLVISVDNSNLQKKAYRFWQTKGEVGLWLMGEHGTNWHILIIFDQPGHYTRVLTLKPQASDNPYLVGEKESEPTDEEVEKKMVEDFIRQYPQALKVRQGPSTESDGVKLGIYRLDEFKPNRKILTVLVGLISNGSGTYDIMDLDVKAIKKRGFYPFASRHELGSLELEVMQFGRVKKTRRHGYRFESTRTIKPGARVYVFAMFEGYYTSFNIILNQENGKNNIHLDFDF